MSEEIVIGVDLGGTRLRAARCDTNLNIIERKEIRTLAHEGLEPTLERIKDVIRQVLPEDTSLLQGIGISAPGPLNPETGVVVAPPNLPGWHNVPLGNILHEAFGCPVFVGNDANVAALAETLRGAGRGYEHVIYITVSTGIGGGIITDGRMLLGNAGLGAEVGHIPLVVEQGKVSTLELQAAGPALARKARAYLEAGKQSSIATLVDGDFSKIEGSTVGKAAAAGDELANEIVAEAGRIVGLGVVSLLHIFNPQIVIIGGGVAEGLGDLMFNPIRQTIQTYSIDSEYWSGLKLVTPDLSEDVSLYGSAALVLMEGGVHRIDVFDKLP